MSANPQGCPGGLECDCVPDRKELRDGNGNLKAIYSLHTDQRPYIGLGVHFVDREKRCVPAFVTLVRGSELTLAIIGEEGFVHDGNVPLDRERRMRTWHHVHDQEES